MRTYLFTSDKETLVEEIKDPSAKGCISSVVVIGMVLAAVTYAKLGWDGVKMILIFAPIFPAIFWLSDRWGRIDN